MSITSDGQMVLVYEEEMFGEEKEAHTICSLVTLGHIQMRMRNW